MRIFDGVETNAAPQQNPGGAPKWLSVLLLVLNAYIAAEQCRQERVAAQADRPGTLEQVMAQAGLKIPGLEQALAQLMGNGEEAKIAASMIADSPDPMNLLERFARRFSADAAMNTAPPAGGSSEPPRTGGTSEGSSHHGPGAQSPEPAPPAAAPRWEHPEFDHLAREAVRAADARGSSEPGPSVTGEPREHAPPTGALQWERPDFERVAREAIRAADAASSVGAPPPPPLPKYWVDSARSAANDPPLLSKMRPDFSPGAHRGVDAAAPPSPPTRSSLVGLVRVQIEALRRRMDAYEAELDARLARAEAELAALRDELRGRSRPTLAVVSPSRDEMAASLAPVEQPAIESPGGAVEVEADARRPLEGVATDTARVESTVADPEPTSDVEEPAMLPQVAAREEAATPPEAAAPQPSAADVPPPSPASDEELAEALGLVAELGAELDAYHQRDLARVDAVEHEVQTLRDELRGGATEPAPESVLS